MMSGPEGEMAARAADQGRMRASHADRNRVVDVLKAAFIEGRLFITNRRYWLPSARSCACLSQMTCRAAGVAERWRMWEMTTATLSCQEESLAPRRRPWRSA